MLFRSIYNIPLEYWNPEGLSHIASVIGKPLHVDRMTASCRRISYARLCIEVNADFELVKEFDIEVEDPISGDTELITIKVEYQWSPLRCAKCKKFGHDCAKVPRPHSAPHVQKQHCPLANPVDEGAWMLREKGKNIVAVQQGDAPLA